MELEPAQIESALGLERGGELVAYCHSGSRSAIATQLLRSLGYDARNYSARGTSGRATTTFRSRR